MSRTHTHKNYLKKSFRFRDKNKLNFSYNCQYAAELKVNKNVLNWDCHATIIILLYFCS
jgi:hypothetical protein